MIMTDDRDLIEEARRINAEVRGTIDRLLATGKPVRAPKQRSAKARIRAAVEAAKAVGIDPQSVEIDGVTVSAANPIPDSAAATAYDKWKARKDARST
jgi:hypothetical protein